MRIVYLTFLLIMQLLCGCTQNDKGRIVGSKSLDATFRNNSCLVKLFEYRQGHLQKKIGPIFIFLQTDVHIAKFQVSNKMSVDLLLNNKRHSFNTNEVIIVNANNQRLVSYKHTYSSPVLEQISGDKALLNQFVIEAIERLSTKQKKELAL